MIWDRRLCNHSNVCCDVRIEVSVPSHQSAVYGPWWIEIHHGFSSSYDPWPGRCPRSGLSRVFRAHAPPTKTLPAHNRSSYTSGVHYVTLLMLASNQSDHLLARKFPMKNHPGTKLSFFLLKSISNSGLMPLRDLEMIVCRHLAHLNVIKTKGYDHVVVYYISTLHKS